MFVQCIAGGIGKTRKASQSLDDGVSRQPNEGSKFQQHGTGLMRGRLIAQGIHHIEFESPLIDSAMQSLTAWRAITSITSISASEFAMALPNLRGLPSNVLSTCVSVLRVGDLRCGETSTRQSAE